MNKWRVIKFRGKGVNSSNDPLPYSSFDKPVSFNMPESIKEKRSKNTYLYKSELEALKTQVKDLTKRVDHLESINPDIKPTLKGKDWSGLVGEAKQLKTIKKKTI